MADPTSSSGSDGQLVVTVDSRQAITGINAIEERMLRMGQTVNRGLDRMGSAFDRFVSTVKKAGAAIAAYMSVKALIGMFDQLIHRIIEVNRVYTGFIASMSIVRGSTNAAAKEYEFLLSISNKLGVAIETSITQYHRLAAALKNVDTTGELTRHLFSGLSQAAVVLHAKGRDVTLIFEAVQQMASKGKLSLEELQRQLGNTLPGAVSLAARAMMQSRSFIEAGVKNAAEAEQKLRKGIEKGTINVYEFLALLSNQLKKEYGAGVKYASDQFTANFNRMKNSVFEFYRMVGSSGAMEGLTDLIKEITALFNDGAGQGAFGIGQALGNAFKDIAQWVKQLDSRDVAAFFSAVKGAIISTAIVIEEFFKIVAGFSGPEIKDPMLAFVSVIAKSMAAVVDIINVAVAGIEAGIRAIMAVFLELRAGLSTLMTSMTSGMNYVVQRTPGLSDEYKANAQASADEWSRRDAGYQKAAEDNATRAAAQLKNFAVGPDQNAYDRVSGVFTQLQAELDKVQGGRKAGSTADAAAGYVNPLGDADLQKLLEGILANSNAPNSEGKSGKAGKSAEAALRRQIREFERLEDAVSKWRGEAGVTEKATEKLKRAQDDLSDAVGKLDPKTGKLLLTQEEANDIMETLRFRYAEALDPIGYLLDLYDREAKALRFVGDEAKVYSEILAQQQKWREDNVKFDEKDIENLRTKIEEQQRLNRMQSQMDSILQDTVYRKRDGQEEIQALGQLSRGYENPDGKMTQISEGEKATKLMSIFGEDVMNGTKEFYDAQYEIYEEFLDKVKAAREQGLIEEQTAQQLSLDAWVRLNQAKFEAMESSMSNIALLMNSNNKKAFKIGQAAAIAQTTMATATAAIEAYKSAAAIPYVGWIMGPLAAAGAIAYGASQISQIRSQQPPGFRTGGSYVVGGSGGDDSQRVTFDATPGEVININTPTQAKALERLSRNVEDGAGKSRGNFTQNLTIVQQGRPNNKTSMQEARHVRKQTTKALRMK